MMYSLVRMRDSAGDIGQMSIALFPRKDGTVSYQHNRRPRVGVAMRVGSLYARTYDPQDWWQTTLITEILVNKRNYVKFKTGNSVYEWTRG